VVWTVFGIVDLVAAAALGVLHSHSRIGLLAGEITTDSMRALPMSLIPTFIVPLLLVVHALSFAALRGGWQREISVVARGSASDNERPHRGATSVGAR
jgi:hypothetical protein